MASVSDWELLTRYVESADQDAFAQLVRRHIGFVYSLACRQTHDVHLSEDVTQAVMIVLARKAATISGESVLPSWLFTVTRHASRNALKLRARQEFHERNAARQRAEIVESVGADDSLHDVLDEAIARLPEVDRSGVLLHYFEGHTHEAVAAKLGLTAHASRKRVSRAVEKMRSFLAGRGVAVTSAAAVAALRAGTTTVAVPAELISSSINVAMLSTGVAGSGGGSSMLIAQGVTRMFTLAKLKVAATIALVVAGAAGASVPLVDLALRSIVTHSTTTTLIGEPATMPAAATDPRFSTQLSPEITVRFLGVSPCPGDENSWFTIAGDPIELPDARLLQSDTQSNVEPEHQLAIKVDKPKDALVLIYIDDATMASNSNTEDDEGHYLLSKFTLQGASNTVSIRLGISTAEWKTVAASDDAQQPTEIDAGDFGTISFTPPDVDTLVGGTKVEVHHRTLDLPYRVVAIDANGNEIASNNVNVNNTNDDATSTYTFDLPQDQIKKVLFQVREIDKWLEAKDISLTAEHKTQPKIVVKDGKAKK